MKIVILFALNPIIVNFGQFDKTEGNEVKLLFEKKAIFNFLKSPKSDGNSNNLFPDKSKNSKVSFKSNNSRGNSVNPSDILIFNEPFNSPFFNSCSVCIILICKN